ncbi:GGDEF domain-containing protein, partial [Pseudomonas sp. CrR25]|nr:GGDEF domain-containing protein [Pseudomonas sp. CrR25]
MSLSHAWLDDVRPSPYADQLVLGFRLLRFTRPLEREYRTYLLEDSYDLKLIALSVGVAIWLAFAGLDFLAVPGRDVWWMLAV